MIVCVTKINMEKGFIDKVKSATFSCTAYRKHLISQHQPSNFNSANLSHLQPTWLFMSCSQLNRTALTELQPYLQQKSTASRKLSGFGGRIIKPSHTQPQQPFTIAEHLHLPSPDIRQRSISNFISIKETDVTYTNFYKRFAAKINRLYIYPSLALCKTNKSKTNLQTNKKGTFMDLKGQDNGR